MQVVTCRVGGSLRPADNTRIDIHCRQGRRVVLGVTAPAGTELILGSAALRPVSGTAGISGFLFSMQSIRQFRVGGFDVRVWLPGELVPLAADCEDWLHVGIARHQSREASQFCTCVVPAPAFVAPWPLQAPCDSKKDTDRC